MVITRTPFRMSFFGGGTDMKEYFEKQPGAVISTTFDKYCQVVVRHLPPFFEYKSEFSYSKIERVNSIADIEHPAIRNAMLMKNMHNIRLGYEADLPARSGLGTSSSFAVGMLNAFSLLNGEELSKNELAKEAIHLERDLCQETGGWQDQIAAAYGGFNRIDFDENGFKVSPLNIEKRRKELLNSRLMMFFTGFTRFSADIQRVSLSEKNDRNDQLKEMYSLVDVAQKVLEDSNRDLDEFGKLLAHTWELKRGTSSVVSTSTIDLIYQKGINAGAIGGKLLGAGGGGFFVFYVPLDKQQAVKEALSDLLFIPFKFEDYGSTVILKE